MALSNINQILLRNIELLESANPLLINIEAHELTSELINKFTDINITCFNSNFAQYQSIKSKQQAKVNAHFGSHYQSDLQHDLVLIAFPKSKPELALTLAMIAPVVTEDTIIVFVGDNKGGIKSVAKLSSDYIEHCIKQDNARHCLLFTGRYTQPGKSFNIKDWFTYYDVNIAEQTIKIAALPGVFSQKGLDKGTQVLLDHLPENIQGKILDFGCGSGVISAVLATLHPHIKPTLIDVSALAIDSAKETLSLNNIEGDCVASDGLSHVNNQYDTIISNPPFHQGLKTHYAATEIFLANCSKHLKTKGTLLVVANSFLKYEPIMQRSIGHTKQVVVKNGFTVYLSNKQ